MFIIGFIPAFLGGITLAKAGANFFSNRKDNKAIDQNIQNIRKIGAEATGFARQAAEGFQAFDPLEGFDEELAARTRAPLESVRASAISRGSFRSGRAVADEQRVIGQESAQLLTQRKRLELQGLAGLQGAAGTIGEVGTSVEAGLADFRQSRIDRRSTDTSKLLEAFLASR